MDCSKPVWRTVLQAVQRLCVSTNFHLMLIEPSARDVEGQEFFLAVSSLYLLKSIERVAL